MNMLYGVPVYETESAGDKIFLLPELKATVFIPPSGYYSSEDMLRATFSAITDEAVAAARRGRVAVITGIDGSQKIEGIPRK